MKKCLTVVLSVLTAVAIAVLCALWLRAEPAPRFSDVRRSDPYREYILDLVIATRPGQQNALSDRQRGVKLAEIDRLVTFGASPRASIAMALAAKGLALLRERAFVLPQDVKDLAPDILRHRLVLSYEAEAENIDADAIIARLLSELRTP